MINLILFGPPGAGKGTQSAKLIEKYSLTHISTGDLFRKHLKEGTPLGKLAQDFMNKGNLVPDQVVIDMVDDKITSSNNISGIIFDGFPRTIPQSQALDKLLAAKNAPIKILVELIVPEPELRKRLAERAIKENRPDDAKPEVIENRIGVYRAETAVVADYYKKQSKYSSVIGVGGIEEIFKNVCREIDKKSVGLNYLLGNSVSSQNFIDYVKFNSRSGHGGAGCLHFHREKFIQKGGPDGGDGGRGGHVILRGNAQLWTLLHLKYRKHIIASHGTAGEAQNCTGADGEDEMVDVPLGTVAKDSETGEILCEINEDAKEFILSPGGRGEGNAYFATATKQAPQYAQPGEPGKEHWVILELKLLADVGLVGFPNAGKSTLLSVVSAAKPKIADYPFTTLTPNLGVVSYRDGLSFVMADIPGIIEGAAEGRGLGIRFLRHIERNSLLLFLIPADAKDVKEYEILLNELRKYNPELLDKKRLLAISKSDMLDEELQQEIKRELPDEIPAVLISSITQQGIMELKDLIWKNLH